MSLLQIDGKELQKKKIFLKRRLSPVSSIIEIRRMARVHLGDSYFGGDVMCAGAFASARSWHCLSPATVKANLHRAGKGQCDVVYAGEPVRRPASPGRLLMRSLPPAHSYVSVEPAEASAAYAVVVSKAEIAEGRANLPAVLRSARDFSDLHKALRSRIFATPLPDLPAKPAGLLSSGPSGRATSPNSASPECARCMVA